MPPKPPRKINLIHEIQELLQHQQVKTQDDICAALTKKGIAVNQVKISRLLNKLGAVKMKEGGETIYRLPTETANVTPQDSLRHLVLHIKHNESLILIQTMPGSAQLVARLLDQLKDIGILGTVAGDDTIFIAPESTKQIKTIYQQINTLFFN